MFGRTPCRRYCGPPTLARVATGTTVGGAAAAPSLCRSCRHDGMLTSDITAPLEVFGNAARKPRPQKISLEAVAADVGLDILTEEGIS
jgi:hypothetical protein